MTIGFLDQTATRRIPDKGFSKNLKPIVTVVDFADGYEQRFSKGINTVEETYNLSFSNRSTEEIQSIASFLDSKKDVESFLFTVPNETVVGNEEDILVVVQDSYTVSYFNEEVSSLNVTLKRVYEAAAVSYTLTDILQGVSDFDFFSVTNNEAKSFYVKTTGVPDGTVLYLNEESTGYTSGAIQSFSTTTTINNGLGLISMQAVGAASLLSNLITTFTVRTTSVSGPIVLNFSVEYNGITNPSYSIQDSGGNPITSITMDEGVTQNVYFNVLDDYPSSYYWTLDGATTDDFQTINGGFSNSGTVGSNTGIFSISTIADNSGEGDENYTLRVRSGSIVGPTLDTITVTVIDTSRPEEQLTFDNGAQSVLAGSVASFDVTGVFIGGNTVYWRIVSAGSDFISSSGTISLSSILGSPPTSVGSFSVNYIGGASSSYAIEISEDADFTDIRDTATLSVVAASFTDGASTDLSTVVFSTEDSTQIISIEASGIDPAQESLYYSIDGKYTGEQISGGTLVNFFNKDISREYLTDSGTVPGLTPPYADNDMLVKGGLTYDRELNMGIRVYRNNISASEGLRITTWKMEDNFTDPVFYINNQVIALNSAFGTDALRTPKEVGTAAYNGTMWTYTDWQSLIKIETTDAWQTVGNLTVTEYPLAKLIQNMSWDGGRYIVLSLQDPGNLYGSIQLFDTQSNTVVDTVLDTDVVDFTKFNRSGGDALFGQTMDISGNIVAAGTGFWGQSVSFYEDICIFDISGGTLDYKLTIPNVNLYGPGSQGSPQSGNSSFTDFFGVDFVLDEDRIYVVAPNEQIQGSPFQNTLPNDAVPHIHCFKQENNWDGVTLQWSRKSDNWANATVNTYVLWRGRRLLNSSMGHVPSITVTDYNLVITAGYVANQQYNQVEIWNKYTGSTTVYERDYLMRTGDGNNDGGFWGQPFHLSNNLLVMHGNSTYEINQQSFARDRIMYAYMYENSLAPDTLDFNNLQGTIPLSGTTGSSTGSLSLTSFADSRTETVGRKNNATFVLTLRLNSAVGQVVDTIGLQIPDDSISNTISGYSYSNTSPVSLVSELVMYNGESDIIYYYHENPKYDDGLNPSGFPISGVDGFSSSYVGGAGNNFRSWKRNTGTWNGPVVVTAAPDPTGTKDSIRTYKRFVNTLTYEDQWPEVPVVNLTGYCTITDSNSNPVLEYSILEGNSKTVYADFINYKPGTFYWTIEGTAGEFVSTSGSFTSTEEENSTRLRKHCIGNFNISSTSDGATTGQQSFTLNIREDSITGTIIETITLQLEDFSQGTVKYNFVDQIVSPQVSISELNLDENNTPVAVSVRTEQVTSGTTLFWTIENSSQGQDFVNVSGSFSVSGTLSESFGTFVIVPKANFTTEGDRTKRLYIRLGSITGTPLNVLYLNITDTSIGNYNIKPGKFGSLNIRNTRSNSIVNSTQGVDQYYGTAADFKQGQLFVSAPGANTGEIYRYELASSQLSSPNLGTGLNVFKNFPPTTITETFSNPNNNSSDNFGQQLLVSEGREVMFVTAPGYNSGEGIAYIYDLAGSPQLALTINRPEGALGTFGNCLSHDPRTFLAAVGCKTTDTTPGKVFLYRFGNQDKGPIVTDKYSTAFAAGDIVNWPLREFRGPSLNDGFGHSVSISKRFIAIGAPNTSSDRGKVYIYSTDSVYSLISVIDGPFIGTGLFGSAISTSGDFVAISAIGDGPGRVYTYKIDQFGSTLISTISMPTGYSPNIGRQFGESLFLEGNILFASAYNNYSGVAFKFDTFTNGLLDIFTVAGASSSSDNYFKYIKFAPPFLLGGHPNSDYNDSSPTSSISNSGRLTIYDSFYTPNIDKTVRIDMADPSGVFTLNNQSTGIPELAFDPTETYAVMLVHVVSGGSSLGQLCLFDITTSPWTPIRSFEDSTAFQIDFAPFPRIKVFLTRDLKVLLQFFTRTAYTSPINKANQSSSYILDMASSPASFTYSRSTTSSTSPVIDGESIINSAAFDENTFFTCPNPSYLSSIILIHERDISTGELVNTISVPTGGQLPDGGTGLRVYNGFLFFYSARLLLIWKLGSYETPWARYDNTWAENWGNPYNLTVFDNYITSGDSLWYSESGTWQDLELIDYQRDHTDAFNGLTNEGYISNAYNSFSSGSGFNDFVAGGLSWPLIQNTDFSSPISISSNTDWDIYGTQTSENFYAFYADTTAYPVNGTNQFLRLLKVPKYSLDPSLQITIDSSLVSQTGSGQFQFYLADSNIGDPISVDWGDGVVEQPTAPNTVSHTYSSSGTKTIKITGTGAIKSASTPSLADNKIISIISGVDITYTSLEEAFAGQTNLQSVTGKFNGTYTNAARMFLNCSSLGTISGIVVNQNSSVTDFTSIFEGCSSLSSETGVNFSSAQSYASAFKNTSSFSSGSLSFIDTSNATTFSSMFEGSSFNQDVSSWNTTSLTANGLVGMFKGNTSFNSPIFSNLPAAVTSIESLFEGASSFNTSIGTLNVSNIVNMQNCFKDATSFNQDLTAWDPSSTTNMIGMFFGATVFNQDCSLWNVTLISAEPTNFKTNSSLTAQNTPIWGTNPGVALIIGIDSTLAVTPETFRIDVQQTEVGDPITINYGDGGGDTTPAVGVDSNVYSTANTYFITITGTGHLRFNLDPAAITFVRFGSSFKPTTFVNTFNGCSNIPQYSGTINFAEWGTGQSLLTSGYNSAFLDNTGVTGSLFTTQQTFPWARMIDTFRGCTNMLTTNVIYDSSIGATGFANFESVFKSCTNFEEDLSSWNVNYVSSMSSAFSGCSSFTGTGLSTWSPCDSGGVYTGSISSISFLFENASLANPNISSWTFPDCSGISGQSAFENASAFNSPLASFPSSKLRNMKRMFFGANSFNQSLNTWNIGAALNTNDTANFLTSTSWNNGFAPGISNNCTLTMSFPLGQNGGIFVNASSMNCDFPNIDVSNCTNLENTFSGCSSFNGNLSTWSVGNVTNFNGFFVSCAVFNNNSIVNWNTASATNMNNMFLQATNFNQDLTGWPVPLIPSEPFSFAVSSALTPGNKPLWGVSVDGLKADIDASLVGGTQVQRYQLEIVQTEVGNPINIDWGDGSGVTVPSVGTVFHDYPAALTYSINITGAGHVRLCEHDGSKVSNLLFGSLFKPTSFESTFRTYSSGNGITSFSGEPNWLEWGTNATSYLENAFKDNAGITTAPTWTVPTDTSNYDYCFENCTSLASTGWTISTATATNATMVGMFKGCSSFNEEMGGWTMTNISDISEMFMNCTGFSNAGGSFTWTWTNNPQIVNTFRNTNITGVGTNNWTFPGTNTWSMSGCFADSSGFRDDLSSWDVSYCSNFSEAFLNCNDISFNFSIDSWSTLNVVSFDRMFENASKWNNGSSANVNNNCTASLKISSAIGMFQQTSGMNCNFSALDTSNCVSFKQMFLGSGFAGTITNFSIASGTGDGAFRMFQNCSIGASSGLDTWTTAGNTITDWQEMFRSAPNFNTDIGSWDVSSATNMIGMFNFATVFDQDLTNWAVLNIPSEPTNFSASSALQTQNKPIWGTGPLFGLEFEVDASIAGTSGVNNLQILVQEGDPVPADPIVIDWGDGTGTATVTGTAQTASHTYASGGPWNVVITGTGHVKAFWFDGLKCNNVRIGGLFKPTSFEETFRISGFVSNTNFTTCLPGTVFMDWSEWRNGATNNDFLSMFQQCTALTSVPENWAIPASTLSFQGCFTSMSSLTNVSWQIDTSSQTTVNMSQMFSGCSSFADSDNNLQAWDVSGVSNFASLFPSCSFISPGIGGWNIGNATNLSGMFSNCTNFNVNLDNWVSSQISTITNMFSNTSFNNGLSSGVAGTCNISLNVPDAGGMFSGNNDINLKFPNLDFTNCTSIANLFPSCTSYNQSIEWINVTSTCTNFSRTFDGCSIFDQDLYYLETSGGTNFDRMLEDCTAFNNGGNTLQNVFRPASGIDPFRQVFKNCTSFNQAIPNLRTENATHLTNVFNNCIAFNQDLSYLQTGNATDMTGMFTGCTVFDQDLTYWNVSGVGVEPTDFSTASALNTANKPIWGSAPSFGLIMEVDTTLADLTPAGQFQIDVTDFNPTSSDPITVEWGDGNSDVAVANGTLSHTYGASAVYEVNITGTGAFTNLNQDKLKIDKLKWGPDFIPTSLNQAFEGATNITQSLGEPSWAQFTGTLNRTYYSNSSLSLVSSWSPVNALIYSSLFFDCSTLERVNWYFDTSGATNSVSFNGMFENCTTFNDYIRGWDLSANGFQFQMSQMFNGCTNFNNSGRPLKLTFNNLANFEGAFQNCTNFVGDGLETWTWSPAGTIQSIQLFNGCNNLDCDLSSWDVSAFDAWQQVFQNCFKINFSIDSWSNSTASSALNIFSTARDWNNGNPAGQLNTCTASLIFTGNCVNAFSNNWVMNCNFTNLDTTTVTDFGSYFQNCFALTVSSNLSFAAATSTSSFFSGCTLINDPAIASYNMSGVQNMSFMFDSTGAFNQDISGWVTNSALFMDAMFQSCAAFDQDISGWNVNSVTSATNFSLSATERGNGNWIEAEHPSNGALGSFFNT